MSTTMNTADRSAALQQLSALVDGELESGLVGQACLHWRGDDDCRSSWHVYHLIGDVLRSDDLASDAARDADFLRALRLRLVDEPVVLAPSRPTPPASASADRRPIDLATARRGRSWMLSSAVAAGFVAVAGVLFVTRVPETSGTLAAGEPTAAVPGVAADGFRNASSTSLSQALPTDLRATVASGKLIRDVRLDRYLSAHKEFAGSSALGVPSGYLRNATADASDR